MSLKNPKHSISGSLLINGIAALLFEKCPDEHVTPVYDDEFFDVLVPAERADEAGEILQKVFGVVGAEDYGIDNGAADGEETEEV